MASANLLPAATLLVAGTVRTPRRHYTIDRAMVDVAAASATKNRTGIAFMGSGGDDAA